ncbi:MAG: Uma2 family endonuclease [Roseofilum sp. Belize BBD 4]|uniref:Uma2 family endonuclease n=1 Tax=Roseofilum sp. Belize BBD 4 TaxID=2821500 RepID=UPI001B1B0FB1|nr:Uma2 family endonuclease [Roseofilum sp. Belize BBD 4]MBP0033404.1 Uma2 family endonuclease [Roseofilum sp. Belize BBD 4]
MQTTTLAPKPQQVSPENRVILRNVSWSTYQALMADVGEDRAWRIAYDRGVLELRMPLKDHELPKIMISKLLAALSEELEIEILELGSLLLEREDLTRAIEPDTCCYIQNESLVRNKNIEFPNDPPPDLAVESDHTHSSIKKFMIYSALGVPELWRYTKETLQVYQLIDGEYKRCEQSLAFPFLPLDEIPSFIEQSKEVGQRLAVRLFRERIREILENQSK